MKQSGFLGVASRKGLIELARDGLAASRLARREQALVSLGNGMSLEAIARVRLLDGDKIRNRHRLHRKAGTEGLARFGDKGSASRLSVEPRNQPAPWITETLPPTIRETGKTRMLEVATVNAVGMIMLLMAIEAMYPGKRMVRLLADNGRCHYAKQAKAWLTRPACRIKPRFIPACCPRLWSASQPKPTERLWGLMRKHIAPNRCHERFADFKRAILTFLRQDVPRNWLIYCDEVSDNVRAIA